MLYFAYGSNMEWNEIRGCCPSSHFVGIAAMYDHRLAFTRESARRGCGVADAVAEEGARVWGVVYEIADVDIENLDTKEGYKPGREKNAYHRRECVVFLEGDDERPVTVCTYYASRQPNPPLPNAAYMNLILTRARYWHLPEEYVRRLEQIEADG